jgi:hypothetical protein
MAAQQHADETIRGLRTTSEKIRALARAGYERTDRKQVSRCSVPERPKRAHWVGYHGRLAPKNRGEPRSSHNRRYSGAAGRHFIGSAPEQRFQFVGKWVLNSEGVIRLEANPPMGTVFMPLSLTRS